MHDVPSMIRTTQAARRWKQCALSIGAGAIVGVFWALFLIAMWREV